MTFSIKEAVKNIHNHRTPNPEMSDKLKCTTERIFEILEHSLQNTDVWTLQNVGGTDFHQLNIISVNGQGVILLEKLTLRLYEHLITVDAHFPSYVAVTELRPHIGAFIQSIKDRIAHYDFPVTVTIHVAGQYVCDIEYTPERTMVSATVQHA